MSDQDPDSQEFQEAAISMLHYLHSTTVNGGIHQPTTQTAPLFPSSMDQSTKCGCGSTKRQSPSSSLSPQKEPSSKRATLQPLSSSTATHSTGDHLNLDGFTRLPLPSSPVLRRTISAPINSSGHNNLTVDQASVNSVGNFFKHHLPPVTSTANSVAATPSAPLHRTVSDPTYGSQPLAVPTTTTPPRPPPANKKLIPRSPSIGLREAALNINSESPNSKRLKRMKERLREMSQWWKEVIQEGEDGIGSEDNDNVPKVSKSVNILSFQFLFLKIMSF